MDVPSILKELQKEGVAFVRFEQTDIYGNARSKTIPTKHFEEQARKGLKFYLGVLAYDMRGVIIDDPTYTYDVGHCDAICFPDLDTFQVLPWSKRTARILIEPTFKGKSVEAHSRYVARRQLERLSESGFSVLSACEFEFYLVDKATKTPVDNTTNIWSTLRYSMFEDILQTFIDGLMGAGVDVDCAQTEYGPGQIEITFKPAFGIKAADNAFTFKTGIREMALKNGYIASFMTKPYPKRNGCSCHLNHSLWDVKGEKSALYDASSPTGLTEMGQHWIAGLIAHAPALALLCAPTINCLSRYQPGTFAPVNATWGLDNRTCSFRVKVDGESGTLIENRLGASACNPYIALAATVAAGTDGICRKLSLPPAVETMSSAYDSKDVPPGTSNLPTNMTDAMKALQEDKVIVNALGEKFIQCFLAHKRNELKLQEQSFTSDWEYNAFFENL